MKRQRDVQRSKVYAAENSAFDKTRQAEFETLEQCGDFAKQIICSNYWKQNKGLKRYKITDGRGRGSACYKPKAHGYSHDMICLPKWARSRWIIIHEFSHFLTYRTHGSSTQWHGGIFCRHYIELLNELIGQEECSRLETCFRESGVRILPV